MLAILIAIIIKLIITNTIVTTHETAAARRVAVATRAKTIHTCHILPPSEIDFGLCLAVFAGSGGKYVFHRIG